MMDKIPEHRLIRRTILMAEQAFIERDTQLLFVPLVEEVWLNLRTGKFIRILANRQHRYNAKSPYFTNHFHKVPLTWKLLFSANPATMILEDQWAQNF